MEYLIALLAVIVSVGYAVFIAVNIERGKSWAMEIARAISVLDPQSVNHYLQYHPANEEPPESSPVEEAPELLDDGRQDGGKDEPGRLAA